MTTSNLDSVMQLALEGPNKDYDNIIEGAIVSWKSSSKFHHLHANLESYLTRVEEEIFEECEIGTS